MDAEPTNVARHRTRKAQRGFVRVEVSVRKDDAALVRRVAAALSDPLYRTRARKLLDQEFAPTRGDFLKALLSAAPLEDIDLERDRRPGRDIDL